MRPSSSARVRIAPASEPEPDSVSANAAISWPCASGGTSRSIWSGVPCCEDRQRARARVDGDRDAEAGVRARELLEDEAVAEEVGARAAVRLGDADAHEAELAEVRRGPPCGKRCSRSQAAACGRDLLVGEAPGERADLALVVGELVEAHRRSAGRRVGGTRAPARRRAALRPAVPTSAASEDRGAGLEPPPERLEAQDLPALLARDAREHRVGVDRDGMADRAQHRQVGLGVRVRPRRGEVDALARRRARASPRALPSR